MNQGAVIVYFDKERFSRAPDILAHIIEAHLDKLGRDITSWIFEYAPKDTGINAESVTHLIEPVGSSGFQLVIYSNVPGARFALETGRGPGRKPPFKEIFGWVQRRGFTAAQVAKIRGVAATVGSTFRTRGIKPDGGTFGVLRDHSLSGIGGPVGQKENKAQMRIAFRIQAKIGRVGTKGPHIFTRALTETRELQLEAIRRINQDGSRFI